MSHTTGIAQSGSATVLRTVCRRFESDYHNRMPGRAGYARLGFNKSLKIYGSGTYSRERRGVCRRNVDISEVALSFHCLPYNYESLE